MTYLSHVMQVCNIITKREVRVDALVSNQTIFKWKLLTETGGHLSLLKADKKEHIALEFMWGLENQEKSGTNTILENQQASKSSQWISHVVEGRSVSNTKPADVYIASHCSCVSWLNWAVWPIDLLTRPAVYSATITTHSNTTPASLLALARMLMQYLSWP